MHTASRLNLVAAVMVPAVVCIATGCNSASSSGAREVSLAEFADRNGPARPARTPALADEDVFDDNGHQRQTPIQLQASTPLREQTAMPPRQPTSTSDDQRRMVVDGLVGQINGRPVYANDFFVPIEDQLRALSRRGSQRDFRAQATVVIDDHLHQIVLNELFLAEAESQLTREQQQGLFAWMRHLREVTIAEAGGTRTGTGQRLRETEGLTIDEYIQRRRDLGLIQQLREDKIEPRVIVTWRDVQREYQRRWDDFNPPATLRLGRIRLTTDTQAEEIEHVKQQLDAGVPFADIAASVGQADDGQQWQQFQMGGGGIADISLADPIKQRLIHLEVGDTTEAIEIGSATWWLHIAGIDQPRGRDLYEVQRQIYDSLHNRRFQEEFNRYIDSLLAEGIYDEFDSMLQRLVDIAVVRYRP